MMPPADNHDYNPLRAIMQDDACREPSDSEPLAKRWWLAVCHKCGHALISHGRDGCGAGVPPPGENRAGPCYCRRDFAFLAYAEGMLAGFERGSEAEAPSSPRILSGTKAALLKKLDELAEFAAELRKEEAQAKNALKSAG